MLQRCNILTSRLCFQLQSRHEAAFVARQPFHVSGKHFRGNLSQSAVTNQNQRKTVKKISVREISFPLKKIWFGKETRERGSRKRKMAQTKQRKVALMGFRSVGKSSLAIQFVQVSTLPLMIKSPLKLPFLLHTTMFFHIYVPRFVLRTTSVLI